MAVTASLVINFGDNKDAFLEAEILDEDNAGKTSFSAGDEVFFRIYHSGDYTVTPTAGSCSLDSSNVTQNIKELNDGLKEIITFTFSGTTSTNKMIAGSDIISSTWMGTTLSTIKKSGYNEVTGGLDPVTKKADKVGVAEIDYDTVYDMWKFASPASVNGSTTYSVVIGITATS